MPLTISITGVIYKVVVQCFREVKYYSDGVQTCFIKGYGMETEKKKVVVAGGGIAGLITAAAMIKKGLDVLLIEKNAECGGLVHSFERGGFLFDGGIRAIENAGMILPILKELEINLEMLPSRISIGIENDIIHVETEDSLKDYEDQLKRLFPDSHEDVDKVIDIIDQMKKHMNVLFGSESPFFKDAKRDRGYFIKGFIPWLFRLTGTFFAIMKMKIPVEDFLAKNLKNQSLIDMISQHFFKKTPAFFAMSYFALYIDYYYPRGGTGQLPAHVKDAFVSMGGTVLTETDITAVDIASKTLLDDNGKKYEYDKLVWAADLKQLYRIIVTEGLPDKILEKIDRQKRKVLASRGAESVFSVYMAVDQDPETFRRISHGHFFYTPSRKGLNDIQRGELQLLLDNREKSSRADVLAWVDRFISRNTFEISVSALHDPEAAPQGKTGVIASCLLDYAIVSRVEQDGWYEEFVDYVKEKIISVLDGSVYPGLAKQILFSFSANPLTIENRVRSSEGAIVGWSFEQPIPINTGMLNMKDSVKTPIPDVLKVGQWAASPAGLPTCILTAKLAADMTGKEYL